VTDWQKVLEGFPDVHVFAKFFFPFQTGRGLPNKVRQKVATLNSKTVTLYGTGQIVSKRKRDDENIFFLDLCMTQTLFLLPFHGREC
jgi:hypothetical protein